MVYEKKIEQFPISLKNEVNDMQIALIRAALVETKWNVNHAGRLLGVERTTLMAKIKVLGIEIEKTASND